MKSKIIFLIATLLLFSAVSCSKSDDSSGKDKAKKVKPFRFDDYQDVQIIAAEKYGLKQPIETRDTDFTKIPQLEKIESCDNYRVEYLSHSVPYLTHNAKALLNEIGKAFQDSLKARGVKQARVCVTSVLRTNEDVRRLQKVNTNAVEKSTHCYGTTFDIAHNSYEYYGEGRELSYKEMKTVLAHVLFRLRMQKKLLVVIEESQKCFHITYNS